MFFLYSNVIKWNNIKTCDGFNLKFPQFKSNTVIVPHFDEYSQIISIKENGTKLAQDVLIKEKDCIKCSSIEVNDSARKRGLGGLLHAIAVMLMKENNAKNIYLDSLPEAIRFHFNNGFRTDCVNSQNAAACVNSILKSNTAFADLKFRAEKLSFKISLGNKSTIDETNKLYDEYLKRVIKSEIPISDTAFPHTLPMNLKMKDVKKNPNLYNIILEKFGIDYKI